MPNPYGGYQTSSLPNVQRNTGGPPGSQNAGPPPAPSAGLLVANNVNPSLVEATGTPQQIDKSAPSNRISIAIQNQGSATVEVYPNSQKPTFGNGGWQILAGGWVEFNWTEDITVTVVTGGTSVNLAVFQNVKN